MRSLGWMTSLVVALACARMVRGADELVATASDKHVWFVAKSARPANQYDLCHHALDLEGPFYRVQTRLSQLPVAMAAWKNRVWIVFPAKTSGPDPHLEVFTIEMQSNPAFGGYYSVPAGRLDIAPSLPGRGRIQSFIGTSKGPVALLGAAAGTHGGAATGSELLQLVDDRWKPLDLPAGVTLSADAKLAAGGADGSTLSLFTSEESGTKARRYVRGEGEQWSSSTTPLDLRQVRFIVNGAGRTAAAVEDQQAGEIEIAYPRIDQAVRLTRQSAPQGSWSFVGTRDGFMLLEKASEANITSQSIESLTGEAGQPVAMVTAPMGVGKLWQVSLLIAVSISVLLLVFLIKPVAKGPVTLAPGMTPLPISLRLAGLAIDMLPAGILAGLVLRAPFRELLTAPGLTGDLSESVPYLVMAGLTIAHSTIAELTRAASFGKGLMGAEVTTADGSRPKPAQVLLRNGLKCVILLVPPLAVFALINPHLRGLPDIAAGTVVVRRDQTPADAAPDG